MSQNKLVSTIYLTSRLTDCTRESNYIYGYINDLKKDDIIYLKTLIEIIEISNPTDNANIDIEDLVSFLNKKISIEFKIGDITSYYETFEDFLLANKFELNQSDFFIKELNYRANDPVNDIIKNYETNLKLISFLKEICDYDKAFGINLKLFYYKVGNRIELDINYNTEYIKKINFIIDDNFIIKIKEPVNGSDRKQLFINELINFLDKNGTSYEKLLEGWEILIANYDKSYSLFLSGFSFDKIKNSSTEYFRNIVDRIYDSIAKVSNYIFGVPIGFIFLLNNFDYTGVSILKNSGVLILGIIFFIMIWFVLFKNILESINAIKKELSNFLDKINNIADLTEIYNELLKFKQVDLKKQYTKITIVKVLTSIIFILFCLTYLYIFIDLSIFI